MTDLSPPIHNSEQTLTSHLVLSTEPPIFNAILAPSQPLVEDDSTISCICGYNDDDGNTVFCEDCNTWQHIECYYPDLKVPDVHQCVNCRPRPIDASAAADRQRQSRSAPLTAERKPKRPPTKSHKKKLKDTPNAPQVNGLAGSDRFGHDRNSGSPHEPPPAKRPKTSHRPSSSTTSIIPPNQVSSSRKRTNSVAVSHTSPTKSPSSPTAVQTASERFSPQFMHLYDRDWTQTETNSFSNLATTDALSSWLNDSEQFERVAKGKTQHDVYSRWDKPMSELKNMSPGVKDVRYEDTSVTAHGRHPVYMALGVENDAADGSFLGELNGLITLKSDYESSSSLWPVLRHPEPFVFYSDKLPICIDARNEGSKFRFIRRSCSPNARMQIIIVGQEYKFCLVSSQAIAQEDEITISWYIDPRVMDISKALYEKKPISNEDFEYRTRWVAGVLAHFGGCACNRPKDQCVFNLAGVPRLQAPESNGQPIKPAKKKGKKATQISPLSTGRATNSRAGSEAVNHLDAEDDIFDSRSISGSVKSKPSSRDNTPLGSAHEASVGLGVELSSREQRKIQEQERLFAQMEMDGSKRKKRHSAGSALNTPSVSTSKQLGHLDTFNPSPTSVSSFGKGKVNGRSSIQEHRTHATHVSRDSVTSTPTPKSLKSYTESSTQTEGAAEAMEVDSHITYLRQSTGCTFAQKLLHRTRRLKARADRRRSELSTDGTSVASTPVSSVGLNTEPRQSTPVNQMPPPPLPSHLLKSQVNEVPVAPISDEQPQYGDVEMTDASEPQPEPQPEKPLSSELEVEAHAKPISPLTSQTFNLSISENPEAISNQESLKSASPVPVSAKAQEESISIPSSVELEQQSSSAAKPNLRLEIFGHPTPKPDSMEVSQMPSTPSGSSASHPQATSPSTTATVLLDTSTAIQSPTVLKSSVHSVIASSLESPMTPSPPQKKKLSLSDWTNRLKKKRSEAAQQAAQNSPLATSISVTSSTDYLTAKSVTDDKSTDPLLTPTEPIYPLPLGSDSAVHTASTAEKNSEHTPTKEVRTDDTLVDNLATDQANSVSSAMDIDPKPAQVKAPEISSSASGAG